MYTTVVSSSLFSILQQYNIRVCGVPKIQLITPSNSINERLHPTPNNNKKKHLYNTQQQKQLHIIQELG